MSHSTALALNKPQTIEIVAFLKGGLRPQCGEVLGAKRAGRQYRGVRNKTLRQQSQPNVSVLTDRSGRGMGGGANQRFRLNYLMNLHILPTCILCTICLPAACGGQERGVGFLELELQIVVSNHAGAGNQIQVLHKSKCS